MILVAAMVLVLPACRGRSLRAPRSAVRISPSESRVDVVLGRTLVMPVKLEGAIDPTRPIKSRLDDGRSVGVSLHWIGVAPDLTSSPARSSWLSDSGRWSATPASASARPTGAGSWAVVAELPADAMGQGLWVGNHRVALNWLPSPGFLRPHEGEIDWGLPDAPEVSADLAAAAASEAASPIRRWRSRLLFGGLAPNDDPMADEEPRPDEFGDPIIEAFARHTEGRWQVALATLWIADPYVAGLVKRRLANTVAFSDGTVAPAWPVNSADLEALLADLLNVRLQPVQQVERARAWLETQPPAAAWVIDDAGQRDAMTGLTVATLGVANLTERDTLAWATAGAASPDLVPVAGFASTAVTVSGGGRTDRSIPRGAPATHVEVNVGKWPAVRSVLFDAAQASPPGIRLEPFRREWDMASWIASSAPSPMEDSWAAAGLLFHDSSSGWCVFLECRAPAIGAEESVAIWLGPFGTPTSIVRISSAAKATDELAARQGLSADVPGAIVSRQGDVWTIRVPVPARSIEADGTLRIGIERRDALGRRSSWPRPMLPWQKEPGRIAVDTAAWAGRQGAARPASSTR